MLKEDAGNDNSSETKVRTDRGKRRSNSNEVREKEERVVNSKLSSQSYFFVEGC